MGLEEPIIKSYQGVAFIQAILLAHNNCRNIVFMNYVDIGGSQDKHGQKTLSFLGCEWEDYRLMGVAHMNLYYRNVMYKPLFADFLRERLAQDNYLLMYNMDEYYLPYTLFFQKEHHEHDLYIYGYEDDYFYLLVYSNSRLERLKLHKDYIVDAFFSEALPEDTAFSTFRINSNLTVEFNPRIYLDRLKEYYSKKDTPGYVRGFDVYNDAEKYLDTFMEKDIPKDFDLRYFCVIMEHKELMLCSIKLLNDIKADIVQMFEATEREAKILFRIAVKYTAGAGRSAVQSMKEHLICLRELETEALNALLEQK